jgi:hypothetical protein
MEKNNKNELMQLFDSQIKLLCKDVIIFNEKPYHFDEITKKIGYKLSDHSICYKTTYGY